MADDFNVLDRAAGTVNVARGSITSGDFTTSNVGSTWTQVTGITCSIAAAVGDYVMFIPSFMYDFTGVNYLDIAVKVSGSFVRHASSGTSTASVEGDPGMYRLGGSYRSMGGGVMDFVVESGDLSGGTVTFALVYKGTGTTTVIYASTNYPFRWRAINFGAATVA